MRDEVEIAGVVALIGAAVGGGLALGMGLRLFGAVALAGIGTGVALGLLTGGVGDDRARVGGPQETFDPLLG